MTRIRENHFKRNAVPIEIVHDVEQRPKAVFTKAMAKN